MKIIHTSDWHFGMPVRTGSYRDCQAHFLQQLYDLVRKEHVQAVLCAGDVYDSSVTNAEAISLFNEAATTLCAELGVQFIVIAGNHDSAPRLAACRELLRPAGLHIAGRLERDISPVLLEEDRIAVYSLPFFHKDEVLALFPEQARQIISQETAMQVVCSHIRQQMDPNRKNIIVSHSLIVDAELSESDRSARIGFATAVSKDVFQGFDYVALGHIHKPQVVAPHIRYCGSPLKYSFGSEERQEKGVVLLDTETMEQRFIPLPPLRDHISVRGTYDELIAREDLKNHYLHLELTDRFTGLDLQAEFFRRFPYLLEISGMSLNPQELTDRLSVEELKEMDATDIMKRFMAEHFSYTPTPDQIALFQEMLQESEDNDQ